MQLDDLRALFIFDGVSDDQLRLLLAAGEEVQFREGMEVDWWWVLVDGLVDLVRQAGREEPVVMRTMDRPGLWAGGFRAWDQTSSYLATGRGASEGRMFRVPSAALGELTRDWFPFGVHLIEGFFQTVRMMDSLSRQREALIALGTLAAGLAHELNNPASATARAVDALEETCDTLLGSLADLAESSLSREQFVALDRMRRELSEAPLTVGSLAMVDCEEAISDWLEARGVVNAWRIAPPLAAAGVDVDWCVAVATILSPDTLEPGLDWVAGTLSTRSLLSEVKDSTARISALVDAVKSYSQLDRASLQLTDVTEGIDSSLVMLSHKLGEDVTVVRDYDATAPRIEAIPVELNQVWTNLIDNAIDAMDGKGTLRISTWADAEMLVVEIGDTGPGMSPEVQARAFEPFFTTKEVGRGTGLGLDISRRIIADRHHGSIAIESTPEGTTLRVRLPRERAVTAGTRQS